MGIKLSNVVDIKNLGKRKPEVEEENTTVSEQFYKGRAIVAQRAFLRGGYDRESGVLEKFRVSHSNARTKSVYAELTAMEFKLFAYLQSEILYFNYVRYNRPELAEFLGVSLDTLSKAVKTLVKFKYLKPIELTQRQREKVACLLREISGQNLERSDRWYKVDHNFVWRGSVGFMPEAPGQVTKIVNRQDNFQELLEAYGEPTLIDALQEELHAGSFANTLKRFDKGQD